MTMPDTECCAPFLKALGDKTRWRIVEVLLGEAVTVSELAERVKVSQYNASKHLRILREAGIVEAVSNNMAPSSFGHFSEKAPSINHPNVFGVNYAHVEHEAAHKLDHGGLHDDDDIASLVSSLIASPDLSSWQRDLKGPTAVHIRVIRTHCQ